MKYTDLEKEKIYFCDYSGVHYIMLHRDAPTHYLNIEQETLGDTGTFNIVSGDKFIPATPDQERQLLVSIEKGRFIPLKELKPIYEIY